MKKKPKKEEGKKEGKKKKIRILAVGDLHGDSRQAVRLAELARKKKVDYVVLCGDLTFAETSTDYLVGPFAKRKEKILLIPGNHENIATADFLADMYKPYALNIHGKGIKKGDIGIFGAGGANIGIFQMPERDIFGNLRKGFDKIKGTRKKVMITHVHPSKSLMGKLSEFVPGSTGVRRAIETFHPDLVICSHVHEAEGIEEKIGKTRIINVGKRGKIIEI